MIDEELNKRHAELIAMEARLADVTAITGLRTHRGFQILLALLDAEIARLEERCCLVGLAAMETEVARAQLALLRNWRQIVTKDLLVERKQLEDETEGLRNHLHTWQTQYGLGPTEPPKATP